MTVYVYKSTTGHPVNIDNYIVTPDPGLQSKYQIDVLDAYIGSSIARYDDGVLATADDKLIISGVQGPTGVLTGLLIDGTTVSYTRCIKNFTGYNQLTGGTINTKTLLMAVPIPDGALVDTRAGLRISGFFGFTMNTNSKSVGVDIGTSFATATNVWSRTRNSGTSGADSFLIDIQKNPANSTQLIAGYGASLAFEGATSINTATYTAPITVDPSLTGLNLYFWGNLVTANTDQITLARCRVDLSTSEE